MRYFQIKKSIYIIVIFLLIPLASVFAKEENQYQKIYHHTYRERQNEVDQDFRFLNSVSSSENCIDKELSQKILDNSVCHVVGFGQDIKEIAEFYNVSKVIIVGVNDLDFNYPKIDVGQKLLVVSKGVDLKEFDGKYYKDPWLGYNPIIYPAFYPDTFISPIDPSCDYELIRTYKKYHTGIDFGSEYACWVVSIADGQIIDIYSDKNSKNFIIQHLNGIQSYYSTENEVDLNKGDVVLKGQRLFYADPYSTKTTMNELVHLSISLNNDVKIYRNRIDPMSLISH